MRSLLILFFTISIAVPSFSQFGIQTRFMLDQSKTLKDLGITNGSVYAGLEYHFRLKKKRIEFHPGVGVRIPIGSKEYGSIQGIDAAIPIDLYLFDFEGDCDCPVWNKEGEVFKKGFFLEVIPGVSYQTLKRTNFQAPVDPAEPIQTNGIIPFLGIGAGLDLGLSERLTLTPTISYFFFGTKDWDGLAVDGGTLKLTDQRNIGFGLRLRYHPEDKRRRRR